MVDEGSQAKKVVASLLETHEWITDEEEFFGKVSGERRANTREGV